MEAEIANKLKQINTGNPVQALRNFVTVRPVGCKNKSTVTQDLEGFQSIVSKIPEKQMDNVAKQLTQKQCELVLDYLHRFMQYIGETDSNIVGGTYLSFYDKIVALHGPSIIINAVSRNDTITNRLLNY